MGKDPEEKILKAERLFKAHQYKKSGKIYSRIISIIWTRGGSNECWY